MLQVLLPGDYKGFILFFFENGKAAKVPLTSFETKTNRRRLTGAFSNKSPLVSAMVINEDLQVVLYSTDGRAAIISTAQLAPKAARDTVGVAVMTLKKKAALKAAVAFEGSGIVNPGRYRNKTIPTAGAILKEEDAPEKQITFDV